MQTLKIKSEFGEKKVGLNLLTLKSELRIKFSHMECTKLWTYFFFFKFKNYVPNDIWINHWGQQSELDQMHRGATCVCRQHTQTVG